jgi:hypothetical protein
MKTVQVELFDIAVDGHDCRIFEEPANAHSYAIAYGKKPLSYFRVPESRGAAQWKQGRVANQQLVEICVVFPWYELEGLEAVGELFIGQERGFGFLCTRADDRNAQIIGEEANAVKNDSLLSIGSGEQSMNLIDDKHSDIHLPT